MSTSTQAIVPPFGDRMIGLDLRRANAIKDDATSIGSEAVEDAARRVLNAWRRAQTTLPGGEVARQLAMLCSAIQAHLTGEPWNTVPLSQPTVARRLLDDLRRELIERWRERELIASETASTQIGILAAIEHVQEILTGPESPGSFLDLSGASAMDLVAEIAHDLRSPLTAILTLAEAMRRGQSGRVNDVQRRQLGLVYSAALALSTTASDVMELANDGDFLSEERSRLAISEIFESVRDIVLPMAEEKGLEVRLQPRGADRRLGHGLALSRVLLNLTTNALKFTSEGHVEIAANPREGVTVEFSVRDTGRGITPDGFNKLYQPFRQDPGYDGYCFSGTGLGLVICRRLVAAMGGSLHVETRPDWGTRFYFALDLPPADGRH